MRGKNGVRLGWFDERQRSGSVATRVDDNCMLPARNINVCLVAERVVVAGDLQ